MRWPVWLTLAGIIVVVLVAVIRPDNEPGVTTARVSALPTQATPQPVRTSQGPDAAPELPPRITVHGVLSQGGDSFSQALLDVDGGPQQLYRIGEQVAQGWSLQAIQSDRIILAKGPARATFALVATGPSSVAAAGQGRSPNESASRLASAQAQGALPGFVPGPPPRVASDDAAASERNRSFLQAVQSGMRARAAKQP
jgi:hypothetical protein